MHKYLVTSTMNKLAWINSVLKFFFLNFLKIAVRGLHLNSMDGTTGPILNIIISIKFGSLPPIQFALDKMSLDFNTNSSCQLPLPLAQL